MQKELIILDIDKDWMRRRIAELGKAIQDLGPEFYEVFNQSSETWHDNAPFDALRDRQSVLDAELQSLRRTLQNSTIHVPKPPKGEAGIGSAVSLDNGKKYFIAGDYTPHAGQMHGGALVVSCQAPLANHLIGKKVGDTVNVAKSEAIITLIV